MVIQTLFLVFNCVSKETKRNILLQERMHYLLILRGDVSVSVSV